MKGTAPGVRDLPRVEDATALRWWYGSFDISNGMALERQITKTTARHLPSSLLFLNG